MTPFITFYTPTFRRPTHLAACMASVGSQTAVAAVEHLVIPDYVGLGVGGMYQRVPGYASAVHGRYVHFLADDDVLASPTVVEEVRTFANARSSPPLILVRVRKGDREFPLGAPWPPVEGSIDLGCFVTRADVWQAHCEAYGRRNRYEGDYDFAAALHGAGVPAAVCDTFFMTGCVLRGTAEVGA